MSYYTNKQLFYINSYYRINQLDSTSNFSFELNLNPNVDYTHVTILDATIPKSNYSVRSNNNTFTVIEDSGSREITIPIGNYSRRGFKNVLLPLLNDNIDNIIYTMNYNDISNTVDTGKYTWSCAGNIIQPSFIFGTSTLSDNMGFNENSTNEFNNNSLISSRVMNFRIRDTFFILSNLIQNKDDIVLAHVISNQSSNYDHVNFKNHAPQEYSKLFSRSKSNVYNFQITDENFKVVNLNGLDVFFTIMVYKENTTDSLIKGFIKYKTMKS